MAILARKTSVAGGCVSNTSIDSGFACLLREILLLLFTMLKQKTIPIRLIIAVSAALWAAGCASNGNHAQQRQSHAAALKEESRFSNLKGVHKAHADSLVDRAAREIKDGKHDAGHRHADLAVAHYYQAFYQHELENLEKRVEVLKGQINKDTEQLSTYKEILKEMKGIAKP